MRTPATLRVGPQAEHTEEGVPTGILGQERRDVDWRAPARTKPPGLGEPEGQLEFLRGLPLQLTPPMRREKRPPPTLGRLG